MTLWGPPVQPWHPDELDYLFQPSAMHSEQLLHFFHQIGPVLAGPVGPEALKQHPNHCKISKTLETHQTPSATKSSQICGPQGLKSSKWTRVHKTNSQSSHVQGPSHHTSLCPGCTTWEPKQTKGPPDPTSGVRKMKGFRFLLTQLCVQWQEFIIHLLSKMIHFPYLYEKHEKTSADTWDSEEDSQHITQWIC